MKLLHRTFGSQNGISRRAFLGFSGRCLAGFGLLRLSRDDPLPAFPNHDRLGRILEPKVQIHVRPDADSTIVGTLAMDDVVIWLKEVVGSHPRQINQVWVETPQGFIHASAVQPVRNQPNAPLETLRETSLGRGMWTEITIPWVDFTLDNPPARAPWLRNTEKPRLYYSQILWVDQIERDEGGAIWYRVNERYGFGDRMWAPAEAFRPITAEEMTPISPDADDKRILVDLDLQTLSCFEGAREVYFCRISSGVNFDPQGEPIERSSTPAGPHPIWRKLISLHMVGGTTGGGWDLPGIGWTALFVGSGVAIHSTFWHNDFGARRSRGCVNARPQDAKWIFRWVEPVVPYDPGDVTVSMPGGTIVEVVGA